MRPAQEGNRFFFFKRHLCYGCGHVPVLCLVETVFLTSVELCLEIYIFAGFWFFLVLAFWNLFVFDIDGSRDCQHVEIQQHFS